MENTDKGDAALSARHRLTRQPPHEPMARGSRRRLVERGPTVAPLERIPTFVETVGPRGQDLAPAGRGSLADGEAIDDVDVDDRVGAERGSHLGHHGLLAAEAELVLLPRRGQDLAGGADD